MFDIVLSASLLTTLQSTFHHGTMFPCRKKIVKDRKLYLDLYIGMRNTTDPTMTKCRSKKQKKMNTMITMILQHTLATGNKLERPNQKQRKMFLQLLLLRFVSRFFAGGAEKLIITLVFFEFLEKRRSNKDCLRELNLFFYTQIFSLMCQSVNLL